MKTFAMLINGTVVNVITSDNKEETEKALNCVLVECVDGVSVGVGWVYDNESFNPPVIEEIEN